MMNPSQGNKNKNPLLSSAVMGGFEEFSGSGIVLTAAEKPVFTIGTASIGDTDSFSDVSLDRDGVSDTASQHIEPPSSFYSPLAELDSMGNLQNASSAPTLDLSQDHPQIDANLNPISAALAQLPNAASTVFSTFSSIIKGSGSPHEQQTAAPIQMHEPSNLAVSAPSFDPNAPPPTFFSPTDDMIFKKLTVEPATNNTFRLGGNKKKTYAHIPGLSSHQQSQAAQSFPGPNSMMPPMPSQPVMQQEISSNYQEQYQPAQDLYPNQQQQEPEKPSMFSLTSLLPSQLLEKIPSTKNLFGMSESTPNNDQSRFNQNEGLSVLTSNFDQAPPTNLFNPPPDASNSFYGVSTSHQAQNVQQQKVNYFNPQTFNNAPINPPSNAFDQSDAKADQFSQVQSIENRQTFAPPPIQQTTPNLTMPPQDVSMNQTVFNTNLFPKIEAMPAASNCPPPTFFNPMQASDMFKSTQSNEGKPSNPYSSRLSRGIGMYKTRPITETTNVQPVMMPPMPDTSSFFNPNATQGQAVMPPSSNEPYPAPPINNFPGQMTINEATNVQPVMMPPLPATPNLFNPNATQGSNNITPQLPPTPSIEQYSGFPSANFPGQMTTSEAKIKPYCLMPQVPDNSTFFNPNANQGQAVLPPSSNEQYSGFPTSNFPGQMTINEANVHPVVMTPNLLPETPNFFNPNAMQGSTGIAPQLPPTSIEQYSGFPSSNFPGQMTTSGANVQPVTIPPLPETSNFFNHNANQGQNNVAPQLPTNEQYPLASQFEQQASSRPPSIPPLPIGHYQNAAPASDTATDGTQSPLCTEILNQVSSTPIKVDESIISPNVRQFPSHISQNNASSMFFDSPKASIERKQEELIKSEVTQKSDLNVVEGNNLLSASSFFEPAPSVPQFESTQLSDDSSPVNFFQSDLAATAEAAPNLNNGLPEKSSVANFFTSHSSRNSLSHLKANDDTESVKSFNSLSVQASVYDNSTDFADKLDSMSITSGNIGSNLSLFATSELDSSLLPKPVQFESLVPKFLDEQATTTLRTTISPAPSLTKSYRPVYRHWFYQSLYWHPFAMTDSLALDDALAKGTEIVVTDGGRFEVNMKDRKRSSIYWSSGQNLVRRCSWFYKNPNGAEENMIPFDETIADFMENEYEKAITNNTWSIQLQIPNTEHYLTIVDANTIEYQELGQFLVVKRGVFDFVIDDGEEGPIDHLIISISNFGDKIDESADELRSKCMETICHYYSEAKDCGQIGRLEVLPVKLNSVDVLKMKETNAMIEDSPGGNSDLMKSSTYQDAIMKTAFYCNETYYQKIMEHLAFTLNELTSKFTQRNPGFKGEFSIIATSFEALFLFDLLLNQESASDFWKLNFKVSNFYAFGMPSNLLTIRNLEKLQNNFDLRMCKKFLNIVHRLDPIAQRIEPLINPEFSKYPPESIESQALNRTDYTIADGSSLELFSLKNYFTSELIILRITNEIYGALKMDSGSL